jgi:hypothetical protein
VLKVLDIGTIAFALSYLCDNHLGDNTVLLRVRPMYLGAAIAATALAPLAIAPPMARAEFSIAYCDGELYAVNIYRAGDPESPAATLTMRIYDRADQTTFLNTAADRAPNPEGYTYSNQRGEHQWELFIANDLESPCFLSRDGEVVDRGTVTRREPPSSDR